MRFFPQKTLLTDVWICIYVLKLVARADFKFSRQYGVRSGTEADTCTCQFNLPGIKTEHKFSVAFEMP